MILHLPSQQYFAHVVEYPRPHSEFRSNGPRFRQIELLGDSLATARGKDEKLGLGIKEYKAYSDRQKSFNARMEALFTGQENSALKINANSENLRIIGISDYLLKNNENSTAILKKDILLHETISVLEDLIRLTSK